MPIEKVKTTVSNATSQVVSTTNSILKLSNSQPAISFAAMGSLVVVLTTTLTGAFSLPAVYVAFGLSYLIAAAATSVRENALNFILTGLVVFHVARGGNMTLATTEQKLSASANIPNPIELIVPTAQASEPHQWTIADDSKTNKPIFKPW